jgi:hypothetical protein
MVVNSALKNDIDIGEQGSALKTNKDRDERYKFAQMIFSRITWQAGVAC